MLAAETRRSPWGSSILAEDVRAFIKAGLRSEAVADSVAEYVFEALAAGDEEPPDLADALRTAFEEVLASSTREDWEQVGRALVADARDALENPPTVTVARPAAQPQLVLPASPQAIAPGDDGRWRRDHESAHERARRDTADRFIDAFEAISREPEVRLTTIRIAKRANLAKETLFQQFGKTAGLRFAADARRALRLPALWADLGFTESGTPLAQIRATAREYLRLAIEQPDATRALLHPDAIVGLLAPKDARDYRTLQELVSALKARVAEQDQLLLRALTNAAVDGSLRYDSQRATSALNAAWLQIAERAWQPRLDDPPLFREISQATDAILQSPTPANGANAS
jgi:hypothetical protein